MTLANLHDELGTLRWIGADEGWDLAIEAVRKRIREVLEQEAQKEIEPENAFGMSDEEIQKLIEEWSKPGIVTSEPAVIRWNYTEHPCLFEQLDPNSSQIMGLVCSCPKCSPRC